MPRSYIQLSYDDILHYPFSAMRGRSCDIDAGVRILCRCSNVAVKGSSRHLHGHQSIATNPSPMPRRTLINVDLAMEETILTAVPHRPTDRGFLTILGWPESTMSGLEVLISLERFDHLKETGICHERPLSPEICAIQESTSAGCHFDVWSQAFAPSLGLDSAVLDDDMVEGYCDHACPIYRLV